MTSIATLPADTLWLRVRNCIACGRSLAETSHSWCGHVVALTHTGTIHVGVGLHLSCEHSNVRPNADGCYGAWFDWMGAEMMLDGTPRETVLQ